MHLALLHACHFSLSLSLSLSLRPSLPHIRIHICTHIFTIMVTKNVSVFGKWVLHYSMLQYLVGINKHLEDYCHASVAELAGVYIETNHSY